MIHHKPIWRLMRTYSLERFSKADHALYPKPSVFCSGDFATIYYLNKGYEYQRAGAKYQWLHLRPEQANAS